tara:strand:- start:573 stop:953 length:381 start_codon:yes stop_codon:yes gene_type:complete
MEDRIEINGVWYIKEDVATSKFEKVTISQLEPGIKYDGFVFESNLYAFDCTRIYDEDGNLYKDSGVSIKFTDKELKNSEYWDNVDWMCAFLINEPESMTEAMESLCPQGLVELKEVLTTLRVAAWL